MGLHPNVLHGFIVPHKPHPLLAPDANPGYRRLREAYGQARAKIEALNPDILLLFSTQWRSIIGHQIQADPEPVWTHVDEEFHELGSIPYRLRMDAAFAQAYEQAAQARGLHCRRVAYHGFPIDTGTIVALQLLNPENRFPACVVSCNMYSDRAETLVLGKAAVDALKQTGKKAVVIGVTALSNRMFTELIDPAEDRISSLKDDEWNQKLLEFLGEGRLEDVSQLARSFTAQANGDSKLKALWWMAAIMGQDNRYKGEVLAYEAVYGTGNAVVSLAPSARAAADQEFDEDDVEVYGGDRNVLDADAAPGAALAQRFRAAPAPKTPAPTSAPAPARAPAPTAPAPAAPPRSPFARPRETPPLTPTQLPPPPLDEDTLSPPPPEAPRDGDQVHTDAAPKPVGAYPHARRVGDMLYLSGVGPRQPGTDAIPGGPVRDASGAPRDYDIRAQTRAVIENVRRILEASGSSMEKVVDVTAFLIDMDRDFAGYNEVYAEAFAEIGPTRTTLAVRAMPTPIAVEFKVIARA